VAQAVASYQTQVQQRLRQAEAERAAAVVKADEERKRRRLTLALAAVVLGALCLLGGGAWWRQGILAAHRLELAGQTQRALAVVERAESALRNENWHEAGAALELLDGRLHENNSDELSIRLTRARQDLAFALRLEALSERRLAYLEDAVDGAEYLREMKDAFRDGGFDVLPEDFYEQGERIRNEQAERIRASTINTAIVVAIDHWTEWLVDGPTSQHLAKLAMLSDPHSTDWKRDARNPDTWRQLDELERVTNNTPWQEAPSSLIVMLSGRIRSLGGDPRSFLQHAQVAHPDDFWINSLLGQLIVGQSPGLRKDPVVAAEAVGYLRAALAARPASFAAIMNLGLALSSKGDYREAIELLEESRRLAPHHYRTHLNLGVTLDQSGDPASAVEAYREALRKNERNATTHYRLGIALEKLGKHDEAATAFQSSIDLEPQHADVWFGLGNTMLFQEDWDQAIKAYRKALEIDEQTPSVYGNLSIALRHQGNYDEAIEAATEIGIHQGRKPSQVRREVEQLFSDVPLDDAMQALRKLADACQESIGYAERAFGANDVRAKWVRWYLEASPKDRLRRPLGLPPEKLNNAPEDSLALPQREGFPPHLVQLRDFYNELGG
jgi:Flp pilus assembly protein TadD